jgi:hypothetical protein
MAIKWFEDIEAWKAARELTQAIYRLTARGNFAKDFGLPYGIRFYHQPQAKTCPVKSA